MKRTEHTSRGFSERNKAPRLGSPSAAQLGQRVTNPRIAPWGGRIIECAAAGAAGTNRTTGSCPWWESHRVRGCRGSGGKPNHRQLPRGGSHGARGRRASGSKPNHRQLPVGGRISERGRGQRTAPPLSANGGERRLARAERPGLHGRDGEAELAGDLGLGAALAVAASRTPRGTSRRARATASATVFDLGARDHFAAQITRRGLALQHARCLRHPCSKRWPASRGTAGAACAGTSTRRSPSRGTARSSSAIHRGTSRGSDVRQEHRVLGHVLGVLLVPNVLERHRPHVCARLIEIAFRSSRFRHLRNPPATIRHAPNGHQPSSSKSRRSETRWSTRHLGIDREHRLLV